MERTSPLEGKVQLTDDTNLQPQTLTIGERKIMRLRIVETRGMREVSRRTNSSHNPLSIT